MGVYLEDLTYKEILPILARTGKLIDTRKIIEIDLVRCGECKYYYPYKHYDGRILGYHCQAPNQQTDFLEPTHYCGFGERRADEHTD